MKGKAALLVGAGIGYVLGARAGRESYESIKAQAGSAAGKVRRDPRVQRGAEQAREKAGDAAATAKSQATAAASQAREKAADAAPGTGTTDAPEPPASWGGGGGSA